MLTKFIIKYQGKFIFIYLNFKKKINKNNNNLSVLNVWTGKDISIKELAHKVSNLINFKGKIIWDSSKLDHTPKKFLNIQKIQTLRWEPKISLEQGIKLAIESFKFEN